MKYLSYFLLLVLAGCATSLPPLSDYPTTKIPTADGPEDFDIDTLAGSEARLIVSCDPRRKEQEGQEGRIQSLNLLTDEVVDMPRIGEPDSIHFHPHGVDLVCDGPDCHLYVVNHDDENGYQYIMKYKVKEKELIFEAAYTDPLLTSPNSVAALPNGEIFVNNDSEKRWSKSEILLKKKKSKVVHWNGKSWQIVAGGHAMGNGIVLRANYAYVSTSRQKALLRYEIKDGEWVNPVNILPVMGLDNLRFHGDHLLVPAHPSGLAFAKHASKREKLSPSVVYKLSLDGSESKAIYVDDGSEISANATAILYKNHLYISQVFEPYVLKVKMK